MYYYMLKGGILFRSNTPVIRSVQTTTCWEDGQVCINIDRMVWHTAVAFTFTEDNLICEWKDTDKPKD